MKALYIVAALTAASILSTIALHADGQAPTAAPTAAVTGTPPAYANAAYAPAAGRRPTVEEMTTLGRTMFFDPSLSGSGKQSCATCHSPITPSGRPTTWRCNSAART